MTGAAAALAQSGEALVISGDAQHTMESLAADLAGDEILLELAMDDAFRRGTDPEEQSDAYTVLRLTREQRIALFHAADRVRRSVKSIIEAVDADYRLRLEP